MRAPRITAGLAFALCLAALMAPGQVVAEKDLAPQYRDWLKLVAYHIQPVEREVFMKLTNNRERDIFIEAFWKQRDPTPGTPENEYKDELNKRFQYVNQFLGRTTTREGWQTDMGRIYMILGPPASIERYEGTLGLVPCQAWSYYGDARKDLPPQFNLLFFQRGGAGEYKLYDPLSDGPARLLQHQKDIGDPFDYEALHEKILDIAPTLADISITRIPGEYSFGMAPSPRNNILLASILESPKKEVNTSYATHFLNYRGVVSTEYLTNYVESHASTAVIHDPVMGLRFLHFTIVPTSVNVDYYVPKSQFYCNFQLNVSLRDGDRIIFQYNREFPLYFPESDWEKVRANGLAIEDSFPVSEGRFKLNVLLTNTVGKQFSLLEQDVIVPPMGAAPTIQGPLVGYKFERYQRETHIPFKVLDRKLVVDPQRTFGRSDEIAIQFDVLNVTDALLKGGQARVAVRGLQAADPVQRSYILSLNALPYGRMISLSHTIAAADLAPDFYEVLVSLVGPGSEVLDEKKETFIISLSQSIGHPIAHAKGFPLANQFLYRYMLAQQAEKLDRTEAARALYDEAFRSGPEYKEGVVMYGNFLNRAGAFEEALRIGDELREDDRRQFPYYVIRGQALLGLERYEDALTNLLKANEIYNSDTAVLNALGLCYHRLGRKTEALEALKASLKLNPGQDSVKSLIQEIER